jgi:hypothetical protein
MSPFLDSPALQLEATLWVYVSLARGVNEDNMGLRRIGGVI